jgi:chemotaxis protein MotB
MNAKSKLIKLSLITFLSLSLAGCTVIFQKGRRSDIQKIEDLSKQLDELATAKELLADRLAQEIKDKQVTLKMMEKGLVITFLADVLFDSGKAVIKPEVYSILDKVARVLKEDVPQLNVGIEGHTDNQPIRYSGWKSNWELSTARALSVLHYLVEKEGILPERVAAIGYGEYRSVATNDTAEGRHLNRRVEVVILPRTTKIKEAKKKEKTETALMEPQGNLK